MYDIIAQHHTTGHVRPAAKFDVCQRANIKQQTRLLLKVPQCIVDVWFDMQHDCWADVST